MWCWRRLLRVPRTTMRSNQSILKEINAKYSLEGLLLKLQYFGHLMQRAWLIGKDPDAGKELKRKEKGATEDEMVGWHHWLNGHEFEQAPGAGDGQGSLACYSPRDCKESDTNEWLNSTEMKNSNSRRQKLYIFQNYEDECKVKKYTTFRGKKQKKIFRA